MIDCLECVEYLLKGEPSGWDSMLVLYCGILFVKCLLVIIPLIGIALSIWIYRARKKRQRDGDS